MINPKLVHSALFRMCPYNTHVHNLSLICYIHNSKILKNPFTKLTHDVAWLFALHFYSVIIADVRNNMKEFMSYSVC